MSPITPLILTSRISILLRTLSGCKKAHIKFFLVWRSRLPGSKRVWLKILQCHVFHVKESRSRGAQAIGNSQFWRWSSEKQSVNISAWGGKSQDVQNYARCFKLLTVITNSWTSVKFVLDKDGNIYKVWILMDLQAVWFGSWKNNLSQYSDVNVSNLNKYFLQMLTKSLWNRGMLVIWEYAHQYRSQEQCGTFREK